MELEEIKPQPAGQVHDRLAELIKSFGGLGMDGPLGGYIADTLMDCDDRWGTDNVITYLHEDEGGNGVRLEVQQIPLSAFEDGREGWRLAYTLSLFSLTAVQDVEFEIAEAVSLIAE
ncbi:hypothetical protein GRI97_09840 [Altererythrobacter xixiisoli]|uniref:Uncharacterized protein n=2 Tax=Croceibacterium xixiisoli TaxID=1476466 RepID=A0A6I4TVM1_9SPHN|nr:hypothetical protein [Croceibacterium xixiisoli]